MSLHEIKTNLKRSFLELEKLHVLIKEQQQNRSIDEKIQIANAFNRKKRELLEPYRYHINLYRQKLEEWERKKRKASQFKNKFNFTLRAHSNMSVSLDQGEKKNASKI